MSEDVYMMSPDGLVDPFAEMTLDTYSGVPTPESNAILESVMQEEVEAPKQNLFTQVDQAATSNNAFVAELQRASQAVWEGVKSPFQIASGLAAGLAAFGPVAEDAMTNLFHAVSGTEKTGPSALDEYYAMIGQVSPAAASALKRTAEENPASFRLGAEIPAYIGGNWLAKKALGVTVTLTSKFGGIGKTGAFIRGINLDKTLANAPMKEALLGRAGHIANEVASNIGGDLLTVGWWGMTEEQDGTVHFNLPAMGKNATYNTLLGGILGGLNYGKAMKKARLAMQANDTTGVRQALHELRDKGFYNKFDENGNLVASATEYMSMKNLQHEAALAAEGVTSGVEHASFADGAIGNALKDYRKALGVKLGISDEVMQSTDGQALLEHLHNIMFPGDLAGTLQLPIIRTKKQFAKIADSLTNDYGAGNKKRYKFGARDRAIRRESTTLAINKSTGKFEYILDENGFKNIKDMPDDTIFVRFQSQPDESISAYLFRAGQERAIVLEQSAGKSFITADKDYIPELSGTASDLTLDLVENYGKVDPQRTGMANLIMPYSKLSQGDPTRGGFKNIGECVTRAKKENRRTLIARYKGIQKLLKEYDTNKEVREGFSIFGRIDAARRHGFDCYEGSMVIDAEKGLRGIAVKKTPRNEQLFLDMGINPKEEFGDIWWLPDASSYFGGQHTSLAWKEGSLGDVIYDTFNRTEMDITAAKRHAGQLDPTLDVGSLRENYARMTETDPSKMARVLKKGKPGTQREYVTFPNVESAKKFIAQMKQAGDNSWDAMPAVGVDQFGQRVGKDMAERTVRQEATSGSVRGHWGGNMHMESKEWVQQYIEAQTKAVDAATEMNVRAAFKPVLDNLTITLGRETVDELSTVAMGRLPDNPVAVAVAKAFDESVSWLKGWGKALEDPKPRDFSVMVPNDAPKPIRSWLNAAKNHLSMAQYSAANVSAVVQNYLSCLQSIPTAMQWYRPLKNESASAYATRTGIKLADGQMRGVGYLDQFTLGTRSVARIARMDKETQALLAYARQSGILDTELDDMVMFFDPFREKGWINKSLEWLSKPTKWSEEHSRIVSLVVGDEYAKDVLKLEGKARMNFALNFAEESVGRYSAFARVGAANYSPGQMWTMFQTYIHNQLFKNLDFVEAGDWGAYLRANLVNQMAFGLDAGPFMKLMLDKYNYEDEALQETMFNGGMDAVMGIGFNARMKMDEVSMLSGYDTMPGFNYLKGAYNTLQDIMAGMMTDPSLGHAFEVIATEVPYTFIRRITQAGLGYSVSGMHNMVYDARDDEDWKNELIGRLRLAAGVLPVKEQNLNRMARIERAREAEAQKVKQRLREVVSADTRYGHDVNFEGVAGRAMRAYGYDLDAAVTAIMRGIEEANMAVDDRFLNDILRNPEKLTDLTGLILKSILERD